MRAMIGVTLTLLLATSGSAHYDDYGEKLCATYMPPGTPSKFKF